ncbi:hypothetical protein BJ138DRAFT_1008626 [Hygrophoropsis aurantiaca]|uniref:Uncharacterized protein n=1 Tax=Hygrophoropsis aurantiaca TaxID=72124 RepID=A0ACB8ACX4_9AGAM|nr:hypothetical protein BJ138DRAFT_1008626 [Hygrophoropsis aurantiaca]
MLPNPYTPLAWLEPSLAAQFEASCYLYVAVLGVFIWDWMTAFPDEYRMIRGRRIRVPVIIYYISRFSTLFWVVTNLVMQVGSMPSCRPLRIVIGITYIFTSPSTSALFFFRVRAVFIHSRAAIVFFALLWLSVLGSSFVVPFTIQNQHIGNTGRCINTDVNNVAAAPTAFNTLYATLVFFAISFKLMSITVIDSPTWKDRIRYFIRGDGLPRFSKLLFQSGQQYYFATFGTNMLLVVMIALRTTNPVLRAMFSVPCVAFESSMACRVFRSVQLGAMMDSPSIASLSNLEIIPGSHALTTSYPLRILHGRESVSATVNSTVAHSVREGELAKSDRLDVQGAANDRV